MWKRCPERRPQAPVIQIAQMAFEYWIDKPLLIFLAQHPRRTHCVGGAGGELVCAAVL